MRFLRLQVAGSLISFLLLQFTANCQLEFSMDLLPDSSGWGVYVNSDGSIEPPKKITVGSAQVTLVVSAKNAFRFSNVISKNGLWSQNARVNRPFENPDFDYLDFGYITNFPQDGLASGEPTLLFVIPREGVCPDSMFLMNGNADPFSAPNSAGNNPGPDFFALDSNSGNVYNWSRNSKACLSNCRPCILPTLTNTHNIFENEISIYPNPSSGLITYTNSDSNISKIRVINSFGKAVFQSTDITGKLDLGFLPYGGYFLIFENQNTQVAGKKIFIRK